MLDLDWPRRVEPSLFDQVYDAHGIQLPAARRRCSDSPGRVAFRDGPVPSPAWSATLVAVPTFTATTALPHEHLDRATAGLRAELRHGLLDVDPSAIPDWSTLVVTGPFTAADGRGRTWFEYVATIEVEPSHGMPDDHGAAN
jgi:hypothetical protein